MSHHVLPPFLRELWTAVARIGKPGTPNDYRRDPQIASILSDYHESVRPALDRLASGGFLRLASEGGWQQRYWWSTACKVPFGCEAPGTPLAAGAERAAVRTIVPAAMPDDRTPLMRPMGGPAFDFLQHPSRRGNRLVYRDGRVTDMEGKPL